jgi:hypothetical protein
VRAIVESHTEAIYDRVTGRLDPANPIGPISDDFARALRSEARDDDLGVSAALPLLTAAAIIGELELIYPLSQPAAS